MKAKRKELNVDFLGGQGALTRQEEQIISAWLRAQKEKSNKKQSRRARVASRKKSAA